jgi:hypothetical protein
MAEALKEREKEKEKDSGKKGGGGGKDKKQEKKGKKSANKAKQQETPPPGNVFIIWHSAPLMISITLLSGLCCFSFSSFDQEFNLLTVKSK